MELVAHSDGLRRTAKQNRLKKEVASQRALGKASATTSFFLGVLSLVFYGSSDNVLFAAVGFWSLAIFFLPYIFSSFDMRVSAWSVMGVSIVLGLLLRGIYIGFSYPDFSTLDRLYFLGEPASNFIPSAVVLLICLFVTAISYSIFGPSQVSRSHRKSGRNLQFDRLIVSRRLYIFAILALVVSGAAVVSYVSLTGGFSSLDISSKRSRIESLQLTEAHRTWQSLRVFASIAILAHLFVLVDLLLTKSRRVPKFFLAVSLFLVASVLPFYSSTRSDVLVYIIFSVATIYFVQRRVSWRSLVVGLFVGGLIFQAMTVLRSDREFVAREGWVRVALNASIFDSIVLNRNGVELGKTHHIIESVPSLLDFEYGSTIAVWLVAPIPRELWNSKPLISSGPVIGTTVYGNRVSGVPPGYYAEMYWNFGIFGMLVGSVAFGWLLKWVDARLKPQSLGAFPVFVFGPLQVGHLIIGVGLGYGLVTVVIRSIIATVVFFVISRPR